MITFGDYLSILPELVLAAFGVIIMLADPLMAPRASRKPLGWVGVAGCVAAIVATIYQLTTPTVGFFGMVRIDGFSVFFHLIVLAVATIVTLSSLEYLDVQEIRAGEFYGLILFGAVGMGLMSSAVELVLIFVALEISSISTYILAGFRRRVATSAESSMKYFLLGSFATGFFLYGIALMYGATGSTNVMVIASALRGGQSSLLVFAAIALMFVGIGFKLAAAPFHVWTPDVYEGAPAPVVALLSTAPKAAAFAVLLRVLFAAATPGWFWLVWISAVLSMFLGNIGALVQTNVKRMLAYSSIAHAGYVLVAFAAAGRDGITAVIFYAASYAIMNAGAFIVVSHVASAGERAVALDDYAGLARRAPVLAATLTIFLLSLIGIPITGGFFAKFYVFKAALEANLVGLTILGVINSAIAAYYYLRLIVVMYMREPRDDTRIAPVPAPLGVALALAGLTTLYLGILPGHVLDFAVRSAQDLLH